MASRNNLSDAQVAVLSSIDGWKMTERQFDNWRTKTLALENGKNDLCVLIHAKLITYTINNGGVVTFSLTPAGRDYIAATA